MGPTSLNARGRCRRSRTRKPTALVRVHYTAQGMKLLHTCGVGTENVSHQSLRTLKWPCVVVDPAQANVPSSCTHLPKAMPKQKQRRRNRLALYDKVSTWKRFNTDATIGFVGVSGSICKNCRRANEILILRGWRMQLRTLTLVLFSRAPYVKKKARRHTYYITIAAQQNRAIIEGEDGVCSSETCQVFILSRACTLTENKKIENDTACY